MNITKDFISSVSPNEAAVKNGASLVKKKSYIKLITDSEQTFLGGECMGSGKRPYICSVDFINESAPVFHCSCPSRQIPCKHVVGLMLAFAEGHAFQTAEVTDDIRTKRENRAKRTAKAKEKLESSEAVAPKKKSASWKRSAIKKIDAQLVGIGEAEKVLHNITQSGLGALDAKSVKAYTGIVKQLDSYFIPGIQNELNELLGIAHYNIGGKGEREQPGYARITEKLCHIHALLARAKPYLENKKEEPEIMDTESEVEELLGYAWKLEELAQYGLFETDARLVELCFHVRQEDDKKQFVDEGFYFSLNTGKTYRTRNYRPFRAAKHIKEEDSVFSLLQIPKLYIYPSLSLNPRVRWDSLSPDTFGDIPPEVYRTIKSYAHPNYADVIKIVKNQLKNLLLLPHPAILVQFSHISRVTPSDDNNVGECEGFVIHDSFGNMIRLKQSTYCRDNFMFLLDKMTQAEAEGNAMLLLFENDVEAGVLFAQPLALITDDSIVRLLY